ncbi:MAG: hypothetical protein KAI80_10285, partial [Hyphomicrobiaceae bacterium]|nr:hypothetical protein [Hyphomicrobiaceae bacterium]
MRRASVEMRGIRFGSGFSRISMNGDSVAAWSAAANGTTPCTGGMNSVSGGSATFASSLSKMSAITSNSIVLRSAFP